jgi:hypothetical protein
MQWRLNSWPVAAISDLRHVSPPDPPGMLAQRAQSETEDGENPAVTIIS